MVKRAFLEFNIDNSSNLVIKGDTPNLKENIYNIPIRIQRAGSDVIFPCYYNGQVYIFYPYQQGGAGYSIYDGGSLSEYIDIPDFGERILLTVVTVKDEIIVLSKYYESSFPNTAVYQLIKFRNGEWLDFEDIPNLKEKYPNEQFYGASINDEARILRPFTNLQYISSSDNFKNPFNLIYDGSYIQKRSGLGCAISAEISSFNYIFTAWEPSGVNVYFQKSRTDIRRLGVINIPEEPSDIEGISIYRISSREFEIYIAGIFNSQRKAFSGRFDVNNLKPAVSETQIQYVIPKYLFTWIIMN